MDEFHRPCCQSMLACTVEVAKCLQQRPLVCSSSSQSHRCGTASTASPGRKSFPQVEAQWHSSMAMRTNLPACMHMKTRAAHAGVTTTLSVIVPVV